MIYGELSKREYTDTPLIRGSIAVIVDTIAHLSGA
jgi:hypothetical protein